MKDLHSHILYGIDDGSRSLEEAISLLRKLEKQHVTELILTPHYIEGSKYSCNNQDKNAILNELKKKAEESGINIKLYLGNEVFFTAKFIELLEKKEITTLNNSNYLLFEFPLHQTYEKTSYIISNLVSRGCIPILAHPERYEIFQRHPDALEELLRCGVLLQGNFMSLFGKYGSESKKLLKYLLKNQWISFLGSDTHRNVKFKYKSLYKKLLSITKDEDYVEDILNNNFDKVINNETIGMIR